MLAAECYKQRLDKGLSFLEFNYMIMQSYDFVVLYKQYGCNLQLGGDDQWSNVLAGADLIRRKLGKSAYAMTNPLLMNADGSKMGKTAKGAVWLDPHRTTPFDFYQFWRNVADADVLNYIRMLTFLPLDEINEMATWEGSKLNQAKEILADEMTTLIHGEEEAVKAKVGAKALFAGGVASGNEIPTTKLNDDDFTNGTIDIITMLVKGELVKTRSDGRRAIEQGGVSVDGTKVTDIKMVYSKDIIGSEGLLLRRGKKNYRKIVSH
jgi:tyrosyl-tRNA synthetase